MSKKTKLDETELKWLSDLCTVCGHCGATLVRVENGALGPHMVMRKPEIGKPGDYLFKENTSVEAKEVLFTVPIGMIRTQMGLRSFIKNATSIYRGKDGGVNEALLARLQEGAAAPAEVRGRYELMLKDLDAVLEGRVTDLDATVFALKDFADAVENTKNPRVSINSAVEWFDRQHTAELAPKVEISKRIISKDPMGDIQASIKNTPVTTAQGSAKKPMAM